MKRLIGCLLLMGAAGCGDDDAPITLRTSQDRGKDPLVVFDQLTVLDELDAQVTRNERREIVEVRLPEITDDELAQLKGLTHLRVLVLANTQITDLGLVHIERLSSLQILDISTTGITDTGLKHLKELTGLQQLHLTGTQITDAGLVHLKDLADLQKLHLKGTNITEVAQLQQALPNCEISH